MKNYKKTITMLLTAAVLLIAVFMTGCTKLSKAPNSMPSEVDAPAESDDFGVYVKLERDDADDTLLDYLKIVGGETENLSFGAEGVSLDLEAEQDHLRMQSESTDNVPYLAKVEDEIIGTASLNRKHKRMSHRGEFGISLKKAWWGRGAASALMEAILVFAKENDFEQLNLEVRSDNARAIRLYEKYGFRKLCTFPHFFKINGEYVDFDLMNLELNTTDGRIEGNMR